MRQYRRGVLAAAIAVIAIGLPAAALAAAPANDNFAAAETLASNFGSLIADNSEATSEDGAGEPDHASSGFGPAHSVWYRWHPASDSSNTLDTCGSSFDTRIAVYIGTDLGSLSPIAANDNSSGSNCPGTQASELTSFFSAGADYYIAVDTSGPRTGCEASQTRGQFRLRLNGAGTAEQLPCGSAPPPGWTNTARLRPSGTVQFTLPKLNPKGTDFANAILLERFLNGLRQQGLDYSLDADPFSSKEAETNAQRKFLRERGVGGEIIRGTIALARPDGSNAVPLEQGKDYSLISTEAILDVDVDFFHPEHDKKAIADEKAELERQAKLRAEQERLEREREEAKSRCLPIAAGESAKQIEARFPKKTNPYVTFSDVIEVLSKLGCDVNIAKYVKGKPSAPHAYVKDVVKTDAKSRTIHVSLAQPGSHDFVFSIRENPGEFVSQATKANIPIGTDGRLTVSKKQLNRVTVQVIERASGRFVPGLPVSFIGKQGGYVSERTDGNGEVTFTPKLTEEGEFRLSAEFMDMEGYRLIRAVDRGKKGFTSMAGRKITLSNKGIYAGSREAELEFAKSLPVVPANLGTGRVGEVGAIAVVRQADVFSFAADGTQLVGQHNTIALPQNSEVLVGAAPGLIAAGGGSPQQAGRLLARAGLPNPLDFLGAIVAPLRSAIDSGYANVRSALGGAAQAAIAATASLIGQAGGNLISDKGLGVISVGGGNLIGQAGGNIISDNGASVISVGGGNIISDNGASLISDKGLGLVSTGDSDRMPAFGGRILARDGAG